MVFGRLTAVGFVSLNKRKAARWLCQCECGNLSAPDSHSLLRGNTRSCGLSCGHTTHGESKTPLYELWEGIIQRAATGSDKMAHRYVGRGITVSEDLRKYPGFRDYVLTALGPRPEGHSIDRIDNNRGYEVGNLRWATPKMQGRNQERNRLFAYNGEHLTLLEILERYELNISYSCLLSRIAKGASLEDALQEPVKRRPSINCEGEMFTPYGLVRRYGLNVSPSTLRARLKLGWTLEEAMYTKVASCLTKGRRTQ
jgi:hypothetical protein